MTSAHVWYDFMLHHHTAAPCGCGQHDPSEHSAHFARTNWDATLHPAQISLNLKLPDVREHCSLTFSGAVGPQAALVLPLKVPWRFLLGLCRFLLALVPAGNESNLDSWLMFCRRGWWNAGSLHSEEQISPNETPCLIRAADTDNAVTGAGAIYLGLMSTDKSARWDCGFGQLNPQTAHYRQEHCHYFGLQQISIHAHHAHQVQLQKVGELFWSLCQWYDLGFACKNSSGGSKSRFWAVHHYDKFNKPKRPDPFTSNRVVGFLRSQSTRITE